MPTATHHRRFQPRKATRWALAAKFAAAVLSLPAAVARGVCGVALLASSDGMGRIDRTRELCWARMRRDDR